MRFLFLYIWHWFINERSFKVQYTILSKGKLVVLFSGQRTFTECQQLMQTMPDAERIVFDPDNVLENE